MPVKDMAREAAFAAIRAARNDVMRVCRELYINADGSGSDDSPANRLMSFLADHGFEVESGIAGLQNAFRASRRNHDTDAMRKGLRHGHVAYLVRSGSDIQQEQLDGNPLGLATVLGAAIGLGASLGDEFGAVTVIGFPDDAALVAFARAGVFDEFDAVFGARPATTGEGYCYTIDGTGDTLAARTATITLSGDRTSLIEAITSQVDTSAPATAVEVVSTAGDTVDLTLTGTTSVDLRAMTENVQRLIDETPGASVTFGDARDDSIVNRILARRVKTYADTLGYKMDKIRKTDPEPATGWGSVSYAVPTFLFNFPFTTADVTRGTAAFATVTSASESFDRALQFAEPLCMAGLDTLRDMQFRSIADDQLVKTLAKRGIGRAHRRWLGVHPVIKDSDANGKTGKNGKKGPKMSDFRVVRGPGMSDN